MLFNEVFHFREIRKIEKLLNCIYLDLKQVDSKFCQSNGMIIQSGSINSLKLDMDVLWDLYWKLALNADSIQVRFEGVGRAICLSHAINHLLLNWQEIFVKKMEMNILSFRWLNLLANNNRF